MKITIPSFYWYPCRKYLYPCSSAALQTVLGISHCKEALCTWGYCLPWKSFVKFLRDLCGVFWIQDFVWGSYFTVKASAFEPNFSRIRTKWCMVEVPVALSQGWLFTSPFPRGQNLCHNQGIRLLPIPASFQPEPAWSQHQPCKGV